MQFVYGLADPITLQVRYVGKTNNPLVRYKEHCRCDACDKENKKVLWIKELKRAMLLPSLFILEQVEDDAIIDEREKYWIMHYLAQDTDLTNTILAYPAPKPVSKFVVSKADIGQWLKEKYLRKVSTIGKYSYTQLGLDTDTQGGYMHRILHGKTLPSRNLLIKICKALGCTIEEAAEIFSKTEYRQPTSDELDEASLAMTA